MSAPKPLISVIVPHLNQHEALEACLASLSAQSFARMRYEVIVVDNGSTRVPEDLIAAVDGVRLERESEPGPGPARNRGAAGARGEILAFIDADCRAGTDWLAVIARTLSAIDRPVVLGGDVRIDFKDPDRPTMLEGYEAVFAYRQKEYIEKHGFSGAGNLAVRRDDFFRVGPFRGINVAEDKEWGRRARGRGYRFVYVPDMIVFHPARCGLDDLFDKWQRHVWHEFEAVRTEHRSRAVWCLRALAVALSPLVHAWCILASRRVSGARARGLAVVALARVRLFRSALMLRLVLDPDETVRPPSWNRP